MAKGSSCFTGVGWREGIGRRRVWLRGKWVGMAIR